jgi:hypothetical protein
MGWMVSGSEFAFGQEFSLLHVISRPILESTQPCIQLSLGSLSLGIKQPVHEADNLPPTTAEVKKMWINVSTPPYIFTAQCLIS